MAVEFKLDNLGDGVESGDVLEIMVAVGDTIELDQGVIELETDKATVVVPSEFAGTVTKICCAEGDTVKPGDVLMEIESSGAAAPAPAPAPEPAAPAPEPTPPPAAPAPVAAEPTPPAPAPVAPAPPAPVATAPVPAAPVKPAAPVVSTVPDGGQIAAGPAIRRFAREVGVDLGSVSGSGGNGRIVREDVLRVVREGSTGRPAGVGAAPTIPAGSETDGFGPVRVEKMPKIRQTIARKMHESWTTCPRVTNFDDADVTALEEMRQKSKQEYVQGGVKLTTMPFIVKAVAMALKSHPVINASVDLEAGKIIYKDYVNVGIAVDTERGLVVPNLRNVDKMGIPDIARQLGTVAENVRSNNFSVSDLQGGTFTISNLGAIGGTYSTPIINTPETAILLVGRSRKLPVVVDNDEIAVRLMMPLSLSYDHRLIDGGAAARFLNEVIGYLEAPSRLLLAL